MHFLNDSDLNASGNFETLAGHVRFPVHLRGHADSVDVTMVPSAEANELVVEFRAEAGHTGAAVRVRDLLDLVLKHHPGLVAEALARAQSDAQNQTEESTPRRLRP
jgi:hypothetical protein